MPGDLDREVGGFIVVLSQQETNAAVGRFSRCLQLALIRFREALDAADR